MAKKENYYITTAISYPNGAPHIGHAYELMASDVLARFKRLDGYDVYFQTGTDEHGIKMLQTAREQGIDVRELAEQNSNNFKEMAKTVNSSHDCFIRTSEKRHYEASQAIWTKMEAAGDIYLDKYSGWYSVRDEAYYDEDELAEGEGGKLLSPHGTPVEWVEEESYFFRLSAYQDRLLQLYQDNPTYIAPKTRVNEVVNFVKSGLHDLSISRTSFDWGVPVPGNEKHVMYVWVDALTNYITGVGYPDETAENFQKYWPADIHVIGKDIVRFHTIYWPAFLMSAGLPVPKRIFGHGFLTNQGQKMSKSLGNVVSPHDLVETYGVDQVRFFFLREVPFGQDGNYSHEAIIHRVNADLANDIGNLASRSLSMIAKNCNGQLPVPGTLTTEDEALLNEIDDLLDLCRQAIDRQRLDEALAHIFKSIGNANQYFAHQEPWALKKTDFARMETVLYVTAEALRCYAILLQPFMPDSCQKLLALVNIDTQQDFTELEAKTRLKPGIPIEKPSPVFPRLELNTDNDV